MNGHINKLLVLISLALLGLGGCGGGSSASSTTSFGGIATPSSAAVVSPTN